MTKMCNSELDQSKFNPLYTGGFSHSDKSNKDGIVHFVF